MIRKNLKKVTALLSAAAVAVCMSLPVVYAEGEGYEGEAGFDEVSKCSLTFVRGSSLADELKNNDLNINVYKVAEAAVSGGHVVYTKTPLFDDSYDYTGGEPAEGGTPDLNPWMGDVDLSPADSGTWASRAKTLAGYTQKEGFNDVASSGGIFRQATLTKGTDSAEIRNLDKGLYLIVPSGVKSGSVTYSLSPLLLCLPTRTYDSKANNWTSGWLGDFTITLSKYETSGGGGGGGGNVSTTINVSVVKVWDDAGNESERPDSVTVELLCDGKVYSTQTLRSSSNWRYTWSGLSSSSEWTVNEVGGSDNYTVTSEPEGDNFTVTNTYKTEIEEPETPLAPGVDIDPDNPGGGSDIPPIDIFDPDVPLSPGMFPEEGSGNNAARLPQTGQLWWPVPILAVAGLLSFSYGWLRSRRDAEEDNE